MWASASHRRWIVTGLLACVPHPVACSPRLFAGRTGGATEPRRPLTGTARAPGGSAWTLALGLCDIVSWSQGPLRHVGVARARAPGAVVRSGIIWVHKVPLAAFPSILGIGASSSWPGGHGHFASDFLPRRMLSLDPVLVHHLPLPPGAPAVPSSVPSRVSASVTPAPLRSLTTAFLDPTGPLPVVPSPSPPLGLVSPACCRPPRSRPVAPGTAEPPPAPAGSPPAGPRTQEAGVAGDEPQSAGRSPSQR